MTRPRHGLQVRQPVVSCVFRRLFPLHKQLKLSVAQRRRQQFSGPQKACGIRNSQGFSGRQSASASQTAMPMLWRSLAYQRGPAGDNVRRGSKASARPDRQARRCCRTLRAECPHHGMNLVPNRQTRTSRQQASTSVARCFEAGATAASVKHVQGQPTPGLKGGR